MASAEEIAWAAGLFDGEGSITHTRRDLQVSLKNTDLELVSRFDAIVARGGIYGPYEHSGRDGFVRKPFWTWVAQGDAAHEAVELLAAWLSRRRLEQARLHGVVTPYTAEGRGNAYHAERKD